MDSPRFGSPPTPLTARSTVWGAPTAVAPSQRPGAACRESARCDARPRRSGESQGRPGKGPIRAPPNRCGSYRRGGDRLNRRRANRRSRRGPVRTIRRFRIVQRRATGRPRRTANSQISFASCRGRAPTIQWDLVVRGCEPTARAGQSDTAPDGTRARRSHWRRTPRGDAPC